MRADENAAAFGRRIVFVQHRPEPIHHRLLHMGRAGRRPVDHPAHRRDVVLLPRLLRQLQHPMHHRWHDMRVRRLVVLDKPQRFLGVPLVHQQRGNAGIDRDHEIDAQRRRMIERPRQQRDIPFGVPFRGLIAHAGELRHHRPRAAINALRTACRARRVQHGRARLCVIDVRAAFPGERRIEIVKTLDRSGARQLHDQLVRSRRSRQRSRPKPRACDQRARIAILHNIRNHFRRLVPVHCRQPQPRALRRRPHDCELRAIVRQQRDAIADLQPAPSEQAHHLVGPLIQLTPCQIARRRNDREPIRRAARVNGHSHALRDKLFVGQRRGHVSCFLAGFWTRWRAGYVGKSPRRNRVLASGRRPEFIPQLTFQHLPDRRSRQAVHDHRIGQPLRFADPRIHPCLQGIRSLAFAVS